MKVIFKISIKKYYNLVILKCIICIKIVFEEFDNNSGSIQNF